jgi:hypothetical protein
VLSVSPLFFTTLPTPIRQVHFYVYIALVLLIGGFLRNVCIFDDERRGNGRFARGPSGIGQKSPLNVSKMLDGGRPRLALFSCSGAISDTNADNR